MALQIRKRFRAQSPTSELLQKSQESWQKYLSKKYKVSKTNTRKTPLRWERQVIRHHCPTFLKSQKKCLSNQRTEHLPCSHVRHLSLLYHKLLWANFSKDFANIHPFHFLTSYLLQSGFCLFQSKMVLPEVKYSFCQIQQIIFSPHFYKITPFSNTLFLCLL